MVDLFQLQLASSTIYVSGRRAAERMDVYVTQLAQFPPGAIASYHTSPTTFPAPDSTPVTVPYLPLCPSGPRRLSPPAPSPPAVASSFSLETRFHLTYFVLWIPRISEII